MKQDELTLLLLGHSNHIMLYFSRPLCGLGSNISKIFNAREWSFPDATRKATGKQWKMLFFSWCSLSVSWKATFEGSLLSRSSAQRSIGICLCPACCCWVSPILVGLAVLRLPPAWLPITPPSSHQHGSFTHQRTLFSLTKKWRGWDGKNPTDGAHYKQPHKYKTWPRILMQFVFF